MLISDSSLLIQILENPAIDLRLWHLRDSELSLEEEIRRDLTEMRHMEIREILIVARMSTSRVILRQARMLGMVSTPHSYIMLNLVSTTEGQQWHKELILYLNLLA